MDSLGGTGSNRMMPRQSKGMAKNFMKGAQGGQQMSGQDQQAQPWQPMEASQVPNTTLPSLGLITGDTGRVGGGAGGMDINNPQVMAALLEMLKRQQGGAFA